MDYLDETTSVKVIPGQTVGERIAGLREERIKNQEQEDPQENPSNEPPKHPTHPADETRLKILQTASRHINAALEELTHAVKWFGTVDQEDYAEVVREMERLAETIEYRLRNAGE